MCVSKDQSAKETAGISENRAVTDAREAEEQSAQTEAD